MSERKVGSVTYQEVGEDYFKQRGLRRHAASCRCGRSASAPSSPASTTAGTSASAPVASAALLVAGVDRLIMYYGLVYLGSPRCRPPSPHRRRVLVRARRRWARGADSSPGSAENMEYVITPRGRRRGDGLC